MRISSPARRGAGNLNLVRRHADATISAEPTTSTWPVRMRISQSASCRRIQPEPSACGRNHRLGRFRAHSPTPSACGFLNDRDVGGIKPEPAHASATIARAGSVHIGQPPSACGFRRRRGAGNLKLVHPHADFSISEASAASTRAACVLAAFNDRIAKPIRNAGTAAADMRGEGGALDAQR